MKILVTGGAGFIGSHVVEALLKEGYTPIVLDDLSNGDIRNVPAGVKFYNTHLFSRKIRMIFKKERPDIVIHLAAQIDVSKSIEDPVEDAMVNIVGTIKLLQYCKEYKVRKFIFSSSSAVYGETVNLAIHENTSTNPISFYGTSKLVSEEYIELFNKIHGIPYTILRYANVFGPRQKADGEGGVVSIFIKQMLKGEAPLIFGDGNQTRDFVYVEDVAKANVLAIKNGKNGIYNISYNQQTSINDLYNIIAQKLNLNHSPLYKPARDGDILHSQLDNHHAIEQLKWEPSWTVESGIVKTIEYFANE
ncbi:NAD-dependent epimerase/dehydratase family protein [Cytobacillus sp. FJAT-54145]|uniref:NAD-dependent epimerase/dehydratase family protein n=1 Tax=Cytobacillus spartinae TaxID=3299023 RepID=A0ABW6K8L6_9BACI